MVALRCIIVCLVFALVSAKKPEDGRPIPNLIPELYPDRYPGLTAEPSELMSFDDLPKDFNWCAHPQGGCTASWNQHIPQYFPYCYLHASLSMISDRIRHALHGRGVPDVTLSRQDVLDCAGEYGYGENVDGGGEGVDVMEYMRQHGIPDETCNIYQGVPKKCDKDARCMNCLMAGRDRTPHCFPVKKFVKYRVKDYGYVRGEQAMMSELFQRGPISCSLGVDNDFLFKYRGGIYHDPNNITEVDHDVEVVGWGEQTNANGVVEKMWLARNSHGTYFGHNGFFLIPRGTNAQRIEEKCLFATPDVSELDAHLRGESVGSMFGLIEPGAKPQTKPDGWKDFVHDFPSHKEEKAEAREAEEQDAWVKRNVPQPELELRGSEPTSLSTMPAQVAAKWGVGVVWTLAAVAALLAAGAAVVYVRRRRQGTDYESIPSFEA